MVLEVLDIMYSTCPITFQSHGIDLEGCFLQLLLLLFTGAFDVSGEGEGIQQLHARFLSAAEAAQSQCAHLLGQSGGAGPS